MSLNMNFDQPCLIHADDMQWVPSPNGEVERKKLEREAAESGWATTIVRFPPGSKFPFHGHPMGEEFVVLEGVFSDEHAHYPQGTYVRNPPGTTHAPYSQDGCVLFVKLCQMLPKEQEQLVKTVPEQMNGEHLLYEDEAGERVSLLLLESDAEYTADGVEMLILGGTMTVGERSYPTHSWLRFPVNHRRSIVAEEATTLWIKRRRSD